MSELNAVSRRQFLSALPVAAGVAVAPSLALANPAASAYALGVHLGKQAKAVMGVTGPADIVYFSYSAPQAAQLKRGLQSALEQTESNEATGLVQWYGPANASEPSVGFVKVAARDSKQMVVIDLGANVIQEHACGAHPLELQASGACRVSVYS
jgi:hypothetical protein